MRRKITMKKLGFILSFFALMIIFGYSKEEAAKNQKQGITIAGTQKLTADEARAIAKEAYV